MRKLLFLALIASVILSAAFTWPVLPLYSINKIPLPEEMHKQVCISGLVYNNGSLYLASERCPIIIETEPETGKIINTFNMTVPQNFEMEGITSYNERLYLISENIAAIYEYDLKSNGFRQVETSQALPAKTKDGDGMEGIAANKKDKKFYLLRERNEVMSHSQVLTYNISLNEDGILSLQYESVIDLPLENPQWRYSDICYDSENSRLIFLKSYSKGKMRKQFIESMNADASGRLQQASLKDVPVENFSTISNQYKDQDYSMNLEGVTLDPHGNIFVVSDNTSGKARCDEPAREKTILLMLKKNTAKE